MSLAEFYGLMRFLEPQQHLQPDMNSPPYIAQNPTPNTTNHHKPPEKSPIDFLFATPRRTPNNFKTKNTKSSSKPDFTDDVLLDLLDQSQSTYEKRRENRKKRKNSDTPNTFNDEFESPLSPIITNRTKRVFEDDFDAETKRLKTDSFDQAPGSPIIMSSQGMLDDPASPIIGSCVIEDEDDEPKSPIVSSCNYGEMLRDVESTSPVISSCGHDDEDVVSSFRYPTNTQIDFQNFSTRRTPKKCEPNAAPNLEEIGNSFNQVKGKLETRNNNSLQGQTLRLNGFSTANGRRIHISDEKLEKVKDIFKDDKIMRSCDAKLGEFKRKSLENKMAAGSRSGSGTGSDSKPVNFGFKTAVGRSINISNSSLMKARRLFAETDENEPKSENKMNFGFSTALGKSITISEDSLAKAKARFEETEKAEKIEKNDEKMENIEKIDEKIEKIDENETKSENKMNFGFSTALGKSITISVDSLAKAKARFEETEKAEKIEKIDEKMENIEKIDEKIEKIDEKIEKIDENIHQSQKSPIQTEGTNRNVPETEPDLSLEIRECVAAYLANEDNEFDENVAVASSSEAAKARQDQKDRIEAKIRLKERMAPQPGRLSQQKAKHGRARLKLSKFVCGKLPKSHSKDELIEFGVDVAVLSVTSSNAANFKFRARGFDRVRLEIDVEEAIIFDDAGFAGKEEIYQYFLLIPGVDPGLISEKWFFNHYRWIVWKLAAMEVAFPAEFAARCLTLEQVVLQLKFRYDQEIDSCKRSALRKITEHDDIAAKMLVLCVSDIQWRKSNGDEPPHEPILTVEVTDGWYKIPLQVDRIVHHLISRGKLYVGQKIITHNAQLIGSNDPCHPLDASSDLRLKLEMNSTRPAHWDAKLGFCYAHRFLPVPMSSINVDGGIISCLKTVVARIYPIRYMERLDKSYLFRNEKMEEKAANFHREIRLKLQERLSDKVLRTMKVFDDENRGEFDSGSQEIYEMLKRRNGSEECEEMPSQMNRCLEKLIDAQKEKFEKQVLRAIEDEKEAGTFPQDRVVIPFVRILLAGINEEDVRNKSTAILTIWRPTEDIGRIREGRAMCFYWIMSKNKIQTKHILLSSTKLTKYKNISVDSEMLIDTFSPRKAYNFAELEMEVPYDEVDLVGLVIWVQARGSPALVYLIDDTKQVIAIRFWAGSLVDEDCIVVNNIISGSNLEKRRSCNSGPVPLVDATDRSVFTQVPKQTHLVNALVRFQSNVKDLDELSKLGLEKVKLDKLN